MTTTRKKKRMIVFAGMLGVVILLSGIYWLSVLNKAHKTFENYFAFRGCVELLERGSDYGVCKISSGKVIKIVKFENKWYLDGDLPGVW